MDRGFVFALMIFFHVVDDYCLQGILAQMKQIDWWKKNAPDKMYANDWLVALAMHSFSWAFMIMLPVAIRLKFNLPVSYYIALLINMLIHMIVDDMKANRKFINLMTDQSIHVAQILFTFILIVK